MADSSDALAVELVAADDGMQTGGRVRRDEVLPSLHARARALARIGVDRPSPAFPHWQGRLPAVPFKWTQRLAVFRHIVLLKSKPEAAGSERLAMLIKVQGKDTTTVVSALSRHVRRLPGELRRSLTWDRGKEMSDDRNFTIATDVQVYFFDPPGASTSQRA